MITKDLEQLRRWLASGASLDEVETTSRYGLVGNERFTPQAVRAYKLLWTWGSARFSGGAAIKQDRFYTRCGSAALKRRFARAKAVAVRLGARP